MSNYEDLMVWSRAVKLAKHIYELTNQDLFKKDFGLRDQLRRSAVSIASNIAEGDELGSDKQSVRYFYISKGSAAELSTQLIISKEIGYLPKDYTHGINECREISSMLMGLIKSRSQKP